MPSRSASLSPAMNSSWRPNKLYRCPPTPPPEQRRHREHAFILDGVAASNISTGCAQYTCKFISIYPPYNAINDVNARGYFRAKGVRKTLKRTGQGNVLTKVVPGVGESSTMPKNSVEYLQRRNINGCGHSESTVSGHSSALQVMSTPLF
ncbi:hypothetical protein AAHC03_04830 [Spirometra sp. Aus1]